MKKLIVNVDGVNYGDMKNDLVHLLHLLRDRYLGAFSTIARDMDVEECALETMMKVIGVPDENYDSERHVGMS